MNDWTNEQFWANRKCYSEWWDSESQESDSENDENVSTENLIEIQNKPISGMEQRAYISEDEISSLVKIKDKVVKNKPSILQKKLDDLLK